MEPIIRRAALDDAGRLIQLSHDLGKDQISKDPYLKSETGIVGEYDLNWKLQQPDCCVLVAEAEGRAVGFSEAWRRKKDNVFYIDNYAYVLHAFIEPRYRSFQLYYKFLKRIEEWALGEKIYYLVADVLKTNEPVIDLLKISGFDEYRVKLTKRIGSGDPSI